MHVHINHMKDIIVAKQKTADEQALSPDSQDTGFPVPLTQEEFREHVLVLYVQQLRALAWMTGAVDNNNVNVWKILGKSPEYPNDIYGPDITVADLGLIWKDIAHTDFAIYLDSMYQYAYFGVDDISLEPMEDETTYTWLSTILYDFNQSEFLKEWSEGYSGQGRSSAAQCFVVAELANARRILETGKGFSYLLSAATKDEGSLGDDALTVRQMALLAGMEEMSIRAAANPRRANPLTTFSDEGRTRIAPDVAKAWLQSKGRYVPISRKNKGRNTDLAKRRFSSLTDLFRVINDQLLFLESAEQHTGHLKQANPTTIEYIKARASVVESGTQPDLATEKSLLGHPGFVDELARVLRFPPDLFALRMREVLAKEELAAVERELREFDLSAV